MTRQDRICIFSYFLFHLSEEKKTVSHDLSKIHIKLLTITFAYIYFFFCEKLI